VDVSVDAVSIAAGEPEEGALGVRVGETIEIHKGRNSRNIEKIATVSEA
jgi:hypothetical protein